MRIPIPKLNWRRAVGWIAMGTALTGAGVLGAIRDYRYGGDIVWLPGYARAAAAAQSSHLPILISFHSSDCDWCRKMDTETFTDPRVVALSHNYICVRVDAALDPETLRKFNIQQFPATLITDANGKVLGHLFGYKAPETMIAELTHPGRVPDFR